ncbi:MAG: cytochrome-c oxidase, cbb3-type subunit III [Proteobacteria bacterium]|nr:cytochrome-c oxidase, cbb3-type subunit III [Pseudomonadota bacterium]
MPTKIEKDTFTGKDTTGHEWDGVKELNTPLPKWWVYTFYATVLWALVWFALYPSWPGIHSYFPGLVGYSTRGELDQRIAAAAERRAPMLGRIRTTDLQKIRADADLLNLSLAGGRVAFAENCVPCHQAGGAGTKGFPNLADDIWIWGGSPEEIHRTVAYGVRNANSESHQSQMPRFGLDKILSAAEIDDATDFVLSLSRAGNVPADKIQRGNKLFADNCAACHGDKGTGNKELGAPNLTAGIWLYGGDKASIAETISTGRGGSMPAWSERLDPAIVKMLAIYVHALGGGQ